MFNIPPHVGLGTEVVVIIQYERKITSTENHESSHASVLS